MALWLQGPASRPFAPVGLAVALGTAAVAAMHGWRSEETRRGVIMESEAKASRPAKNEETA